MKERLQEIARFIQQGLFKAPELSLSSTIVEIQYSFGLTEGKALEYLRLLEKLGRFTLKEEEDKIARISQG